MRPNGEKWVEAREDHIASEVGLRFWGLFARKKEVGMARLWRRRKVDIFLVSVQSRQIEVKNVVTAIGGGREQQRKKEGERVCLLVAVVH